MSKVKFVINGGVRKTTTNPVSSIFAVDEYSADKPSASDVFGSDTWESRHFGDADASLKLSHRCLEQAVRLAEDGRFAQAASKFREATGLGEQLPAEVYEMYSQVLLELDECFPAIRAAEKAIVINPTFDVAHQTLARCLANFGEIDLAARRMQIAIHLRPDNPEMRQDLAWMLVAAAKQQAERRSKAAMKNVTL